MSQNMPLSPEGQPALQVEPYRKFDTLGEAYVYANKLANTLLNSGRPVVLSVIAADKFRKPRNRQFQLLGVSSKAGKECARLAPGGKWWVNCNVRADGLHQFMAWYSKYLPYAYAMMRCEDGFEAPGIDFESINGYFKTCMGFCYLGQGEGEIKKMPADALRRLANGEDARDFVELQESHVIEDEDLSLYSKLYNASMQVSPPNLPFEEAYRPACCFVAHRRPDLFVDYIGHGRKRSLSECLADGRYRHVLNVSERAGLAVPKFNWGKRTA